MAPGGGTGRDLARARRRRRPGSVERRHRRRRAPGREGRALWRCEPSDEPGGPVDGVTFMALYTMSWDARYAYWFRNAPEESHLVLDAMTGKLLRTQSLIKGVDVRQWARTCCTPTRTMAPPSLQPTIAIT
jgi:hypothetical protein